MSELYFEDFFNNKLESNSIDAIITDPPYCINYKEWDNQSEDFHLNWLREAYRLLKPGGTIWSFSAFCSSNGKEFISADFVKIMRMFFEVDLRNSIVWARQKGRGSSKHLKSQREDIYYGVKSDGNKTWHPLKMLREVVTPYVLAGKPRGWFLDEMGKRIRWTGLSNCVVTYTSPQYNHKTEKQFHPAQKPVMLMERLIRLVSNEEDTVLDPFMGSASTGIACMLSKRNFIGYENNEEYFNLAKERLNNFNALEYKGYNLYTDKEIEKIKNENLNINFKIGKIRN